MYSGDHALLNAILNERNPTLSELEREQALDLARAEKRKNAHRFQLSECFERETQCMLKAIKEGRL